MMRFHIVGQTEKGPKRTGNEDHILLARLVKNRGRVRFRLEGDDDFMAAYGLLLAVADGVGGEAGGARASFVGLTVFDREFYRPREAGLKPPDVSDAIRDSAVKANAAVLDEAGTHPRLANMGCTLCGICLRPEGYLVFNAGDSRVYRYRNGFLKTLTRDDTLVAHAVRSGSMTESEAQASKDRHTITNCLGAATMTLSVDEGPELRPGDRLLICSDGLHDLVSHERLEDILSSSGDPDEAVTALFRAALDGGGPDNISAILLMAEDS